MNFLVRFISREELLTYINGCIAIGKLLSDNESSTSLKHSNTNILDIKMYIDYNINECILALRNAMVMRVKLFSKLNRY